MSIILQALHMVITTAATVLASLRFVHILQLESYQGKAYTKWTLRHFGLECTPFLLIGVIVISLEVGWVTFSGTIPRLAEVVMYSAAWIYAAALIAMWLLWQRRKNKKPLVYTARVKRLLIVIAIVAVISYYQFFINFNQEVWGGFLASRAIHYIAGVLLPYTVLFAYALSLPMENVIKRWYFNDAKKRLAARTDVVKIGVTGSYGKTSTKFMIGALLEPKYKPLVPPSSYNTPMGLTKIIRGELNEDYDVFVGEMGARYGGDIAELCRLVKPTIGVLTSIGKQHLETFGSQENIIKTKKELIDALPEDGMAFFNGENAYCVRVYEADDYACKTKYLYGFGADMYAHASDMHTRASGSSFTLTVGGESVKCKTKLLGKHNILNIVGAAAVAHALGVPVKDIAAAIGKLQPIEHRLELISGPVTVIDDAFNSNPEARVALETLKEFAGRKIVITPGMVELGEEEETLNEAFGEQLAGAADIAILVGKKRSQPILKGLRSQNFSEESIIIVSSLDEASERLAGLTRAGDVVLFENDLPDNYRE
jgi:UDP-N-acetylmuramoyl-tripeptide--D-alanyl-D-alanine ligase